MSTNLASFGPGAVNGSAGPARPEPAAPAATAAMQPASIPPGGRAGGDVDAQLDRAVRQAAYLRRGFYLVVLLVALTGQVTGAVTALHIPPLQAVPALGALELGGVVVLANADVRRRLGERAIGSRILSAAIAAGAVAFNWLAHPNHLLGGFFAGMSALGYLVWVTHAENSRRDRLRALGALPPTTPAYEILGHWLHHPWLTRRARTLAKTDPRLGLYESLAAARAAIARERRDAAIATVLHRKIRAAVDPTTADIAVHVYDLDEIAARLAARADYNGLTTLLAADLAPERIITANPAGRRCRWFRREGSTAAPRTPEPTASRSPTPTPSATDPPSDGRQKPTLEPQPTVEPAPNEDQRQPPKSHDADPPQQPAPPPHDPTRTDPAAGNEDSKHGAGDNVDNDEDAEVPKATAEAVAYWLRKEPNLDPELLAERIGKSLRSVYRHLPADYPRRPGIARERTRRQPARYDVPVTATDVNRRR